MGEKIIKMMSSVEKVSNDERIQLAVALLKRKCVTGDSILKFLKLPMHNFFKNVYGIHYTSEQLQPLIDQLITVDPDSLLFNITMPYDIGYALLYSNLLTEDQTTAIRRWLRLTR